MKVDRVLVPLDGSPLAEMALPIAIESLSDRPGATLILMRATETSSLSGANMTDAQVAAMSEAQSYLRIVADRLRGAGLSRIITTCVWYSGAAHAIVEAARQRRANLIVMSGHFRSRLGRMSDGAVAESIARRVPTPVLLVAPTATLSLPVRVRLSHGRPSAVTFDRVLVPLDGSSLAEKALPAAMSLLSERPGATLMLMRAAQTTTRVPWVDPIEAQIEVVGEAERYLKDVADRVRAEALDRTVTTSVWSGSPARAIVDAAQTRGAQLIAMSTHGRTGLRRMVLGSVAESVLRATMTPVLLVPADGGQLPRWSASVFAHDEEAVGA